MQIGEECSECPFNQVEVGLVPNFAPPPQFSPHFSKRLMLYQIHIRSYWNDDDDQEPPKNAK